MRNVEIRLRGEIRELKDALKAARAEIKEMTKEAEKSKSSFLDMKKVIGIALGVDLGGILTSARNQFFEFSKEAIRMALDMEMAWQAFSSKVGDVANTMMTDMRSASRGMVSDLNLVNAANRALLLGIEKNQLPELMEIVRVRAKFMGIEVTQAFGDITLGIGRQSRLILDNLGIIVNIKKTYDDYAHSIQKTSDQLTEYEKRQAIANAVIRDSKGSVDALSQATLTNKERWQQFTASVNNWLQETAGELLSVTQDVEFAMSDLARTTEGNAVSIKESKDLWRAWKEEQADVEGQISLTADAMKNESAAILEIINSLRSIGKNVTLEGEREKNISILEKQKQLAIEELALLKMHEVPLKNIQELRNKIEEGKQEGVDVRQLERLAQEGELYLSQKNKVNELSEELKILRKEREVEFSLVKDIEEEKASLIADGIEDITKTKEEFIILKDVKKAMYDEELLKLDELKAKYDVQIKQLLEIRNLSSRDLVNRDFEKKTGIKLNVPITAPTTTTSPTKVNDAIIRNNGQVIPFSDKDNILLAKDFSKLGGGGNDVVIENKIVLDGKVIAQSIGRYEAERLSRRGR